VKLTNTAFKSLQTVGSLLLTNSDFRLFLSDLQTVGREVFKDSALSLSQAAKDVGEEVGPDDGQELEATKTDANPPPPQDELVANLQEVTSAVTDGAVQVSKDTQKSVEKHFSGPEKDTLMDRLKRAVVKLRERQDYSDSVSTISLLIKRYALVYSRAVEDTVDALEDDVESNEEMDRAVKNFWSLISSFGDHGAWEELETRFKAVAEHRKRDTDFESLMNQFGNAIQKLFTDPDFFQNAGRKFDELKQQTSKVGSDSPLRKDLDGLLEQVQITFNSVINDKDVSKLINTTSKLAQILSPAHALTNKDLLQDSINVFGPLVIQAIQYIPIPRLEVSVPEVDLLLENLIIEPGHTVNHSSFLPFRLRVETYNDLEIRKARNRTVSSVTSLVTIKMDGISARADEIGFWLRAHSGLLRLADEGIASFQVDDRGIDVHMDIEIGEEKLEKMLTLKDVRVNVHKLSYNLRKSKFSFFAWILKPLLRPILRKVIEKQAASAITDFFHNANRELVYARERLRATRISDPNDVKTFIKAIITRLQPEEDPDVYTRLGVAQPGKGVFKGVYAPGSVVKQWNEEAAQAPEIVDEYDRGGWRNGVFEVNTTTV